MKSLANLTIACGMLVLFSSVASSQDGIRWMDDVEEARAIAARDGKLLLVHFWSERCGPCKKLDTAVFPRPEVAQAVHANYVPVKVNTDQNRALASAMKVDRIPQDILMSADGTVLTRQISPNRANLYVNFVNSVASYAATQRERAAAAIANTPEARVAPNSPFDQPRFRGLQTDRDSVPVVRRGQIDPERELAQSPANPLNVQISDRSGPTARGRELAQTESQGFQYPTMPRPDANLDGTRSGNLATRQPGASQGGIAPRSWNGQSAASAQAPQNGLARESHHPALHSSSNHSLNPSVSNPYLQNQADPIAAAADNGTANRTVSNQQVAYPPQGPQGNASLATGQPMGERQASNNPYAQSSTTPQSPQVVQAPSNRAVAPGAQARLGDRPLQSPQSYRQAPSTGQGNPTVGSPAYPNHLYQSGNRGVGQQPPVQAQAATQPQLPRNQSPTAAGAPGRVQSNNSYLSEQGRPSTQPANSTRPVAPEAITPAYARPPLHASNPYQRRPGETPAQNAQATPNNTGRLASSEGVAANQVPPRAPQMQQPRNARQAPQSQSAPRTTAPQQRQLQQPQQTVANSQSQTQPQGQPAQASPTAPRSATGVQPGTSGLSPNGGGTVNGYAQRQGVVPNQPAPPRNALAGQISPQPRTNQIRPAQPGMSRAGLGQQGLTQPSTAGQVASPRTDNAPASSNGSLAGSPTNGQVSPEYAAGRANQVIANSGSVQQNVAPQQPLNSGLQQPTQQTASQAVPQGSNQTARQPVGPSTSANVPTDQVAARANTANAQAAASRPTSPQPQSAPNQPVAADNGLPTTALDGFCPVTLVEHRKWVQGDKAYGCIHRGRLYLFTSATNRDRFLQHPDRFAPMLSGYDPVLFAQENRLVEGKRQHGVFSGGRVYMFSSEDTLAVFRGDIERFTLMAYEAMGMPVERLASEPDSSGEVNR